jgi:hypothetical protein
MIRAISVTLATLASLCASAQKSPPLQAGAAAVDISPTVFPLNMPGGFRGNRAEQVHDPLHARALVLDNGTTAFALVVVDNLGVAPEVIEEAKALAAERCALRVDRMLVSSTHTHSAPSSNTREGPAPAVAYRKRLVAGIAESIVQAQAKLKPASLGAASHPLSGVVFNRRWYLKPGKMPPNPFGGMDKVKMNPGTSATVLDRPAGPTDPDLTILSVRNARNKPMCLFANYALHYVGAVPRGKISADYYGEFARLMPIRLRADEDFVAMMSNGASGDINNIPFLVGRPPREPFEQIRIVAQKAADTAWQAYRKIEQYQSAVPLGMMEREITLQYRKPSAEQVTRAKAVLAIEDEDERARLPRLADHYARRTLAAAEREDGLTVKLQAIRIGDFAICAIPFETLVEIGLELKERSPFAQTMVIGLANGRHGYLPTPRQHTLGGYETWLGTNIVQKDASVVIVKQLLSMLDTLSGPGG